MNTKWRHIRKRKGEKMERSLCASQFAAKKTIGFFYFFYIFLLLLREVESSEAIVLISPFLHFASCISFLLPAFLLFASEIRHDEKNSISISLLNRQILTFLFPSFPTFMDPVEEVHSPPHSPPPLAISQINPRGNIRKEEGGRRKGTGGE